MLRPPEVAPTTPRSLRLLRALGPHAIEMGLCSLIINACGLVMPIFSMLIYDKVVGNGNNETLWALAAGMLLILMLEFVARLIREYSVDRLSATADMKTEFRLFDTLLRANAQKTAPPGVLMSRYRDHASARDLLFAQYAVLGADLPFLILFLVALAFLGGPVALVPICLAIPMLLGQWLMMKPQREYGVSNQKIAARKTSTLAELVNGLGYFQIAAPRNAMADRWDSSVEECALLRSKQRFWHTASQAWGGFCIGLASVVLLVVGVYRIELGYLSVGALIACSLVQLRAMIQLSSVVSMAFSWQDLNRTQSDLEAAANVGPEHGDSFITLAPDEFTEISLQGVSCSSEGVDSLSQVNLIIEKGERIAIVGRPGSGKSTLLRCIAGVQEPTSGQVLMGGTRIGAIDPDARSLLIAYKPQEPVIIGPKLQDDLPPLGGKRTTSALALTGISSALRRGHMRKDQEVGAGGRYLSGGQRQMIALSRALASDATVFLLDEPTAGVDADTEKLFVDAVDLLTEGKTVIAVTHSVALLRRFDRIVVLDNGRVVAIGPPEKLIANSDQQRSQVH